MAETFYIKNGDRLPPLISTLVDGLGNPVDITGATVTFNMNKSDGTVKIADAACTINNATGGVVEYDWGASDTTTSGVFYGEFAVNLGGKEKTFPNDHNITIIITDALG